MITTESFCKITEEPIDRSFMGVYDETVLTVIVQISNAGYGKRRPGERGRGELFVIDPRSKEPLYEQLARQLRWQIAMGFLEGDAPLPSVRQLSGELGVNPNTIQKAYRLMEAEGLIYSRPGRGIFVTPAVNEQRLKQQETQMSRVEEAIRSAKEMGIGRERILEAVEKLFHEDRK